MIFHLLIVDDEEHVLESGFAFADDLGRRLRSDESFQRANQAAGSPLPAQGRLNIKVTTSGYQSSTARNFRYRRPVHVHLHLCCEKGGTFRHALRLLKEHFFAVVVSDLRFSDDMIGSRAGRFFIEDVHRRNPETYGILYSAYQQPEGFPAERFVRKGSADSLTYEELLDKIVDGFTQYLTHPGIVRLARELGRRGLVYQSEAFGSMLRRLYDYAGLHFGAEPANEHGRRQPRPTLLIDGETGTGKTELAGLLHQLSERREAPFVAATCNQLTNETFLRSILFGHIKGSFSGASTDRPGLVQSAGKGILLLDDLHKLTDSCSVILHSFLDDGEYCHLGEDELRRASEAAIVGTVETPRWEEICTQQQLAESFIHRVEQLVLRLPPLRSRPEDIEHQAVSWCAQFSQQLGEEMELSSAAVEWLVDYGFPGGNSRKLRDFLRGVVTAHARVTEYLDVPELEDYATEIGLMGRSSTVSAPGPASSPAASGSEAWLADSRPNGWQARIARLATKAMADEYQLPADEAEAACRSLFEGQFAKLWDQLLALIQQTDPERPMGIKLFDELLRYYAIFHTGNPANAARLLGMKDNALREFVHSREQKRALSEKTDKK